MFAEVQLFLISLGDQCRLPNWCKRSLWQVNFEQDRIKTVQRTFFFSLNIFLWNSLIEFDNKSEKKNLKHLQHMLRCQFYIFSFFGCSGLSRHSLPTLCVHEAIAFHEKKKLRRFPWFWRGISGFLKERRCICHMTRSDTPASSNGIRGFRSLDGNDVLWK